MSTKLFVLPTSLLLSSASSAAPRFAPVDLTPPRAMAPAVGPDWHAFRTRWGGRWTGSVDASNGTPRFLGVPGIAGDRFADVAADVARLAGVLPSQLGLVDVRSRPFRGTTRRTLRYTRVWKGVPVVGDEIVLVETANKIGAVWSRLTPIHGLPDPIAGEMVVPLGDGGVALARPVPGDGVVEWTDRFGEVVLVERTRWDATLTITHEAREAGDLPLVTHPARFVRTRSGAMSDVTDDAGTTTLDGTIDVTLDGPRLTVIEDGETAGADGIDDGDLTGGMDVSFEVADMTHHYHQVRDWLQLRWTDTAFFSLNEWDSEVTAVVDSTNPQARCNAFYDGANDGFVFGAAFGGCASFARVADVIYHEAGHRVHALIRYAGQTAGNIGEGSSDYLSATMNDDPQLRNGSGGFIREIATNHVYPDDYVGESHEDGLIWASFLWNLRSQWTSARPATGVAETDRLFLETIAQGPTLLDAWRAVLVADDDDGDLSNGTPNDCELLDLLDAHGIGPAAQGLVTFEHEPIGSQASATGSYDVDFSAPPLFPLCGGNAPDVLKLRWTADPGAGLPLAGEPSPAWHDLELAKLEGDTYHGTIERVPANSNVRYFVEAETSTGSFTTSHQGAFDRAWSFWVGDRREVWCDDFEGDTSGWSHATGVPWTTDLPSGSFDDWEFGAPSGAAGEADSAVSGSNIAGTSLDGPYRTNSSEHMLTPEVELSTRGVMRLISFQRWLSVEDGFYDRAGIWGQTTGEASWRPVWTNQPTSTRDKDVVDSAWSAREYDLARLLSETGERDAPLRLAFTLESDAEPTTNYGGWAMDDVCVVELDRPEEHYRVSGIAAEVGERVSGATPVTLTWTMPWIQPITAVAVVVKSGVGLPEGRADGVQIATLAPAAAGETMTWQGSATGGAWTYAVLLNGRGGQDWWETAIDGVNAVTIGGSEVNVDDGCGCAVGSTPGGAAWLVGGVLLAGWLLRRRSAAASTSCALAMALAIAAGLTGCGGGGSGGGEDVTLPDAGADLLPAVAVVDTCGPLAAYVAGRIWITGGAGFGGAWVTTTTVDSFNAESGEITETVDTVDENGDPLSASDNAYACTEEGLVVVSRASTADGFGDRNDTFDPPLLLVPRSLDVGESVTADSTRTRTNSMGTTETDVSFQYEALLRQVVTPAGGLFEALLIQTTDLNSGNVTERAWRAAGTGLVMRLSYFGGDPGFATELVSVQDP